jgi:hypothetical protein
MASVYRQLQLRTLCATALPAPSPTARDLLSDEALLSILAEHGTKSADHALPSTAARVAVVTLFATATRRPMSSDAFASMRSAADAAMWYELALRPAMPDPHARRLIAKARETDVKDMEAMLATSGGEVDPDLVSEVLPENLSLDPKTFAVRPRKKLTTAKRPSVYAREKRRFNK